MRAGDGVVVSRRHAEGLVEGQHLGSPVITSWPAPGAVTRVLRRPSLDDRKPEIDVPGASGSQTVHDLVGDGAQMTPGGLGRQAADKGMEG